MIWALQAVELHLNQECPRKADRHIVQIISHARLQLAPSCPTSTMGSGSVLVLFSLICASQQIALQSSKLCKPLSTSDSWPSAYTWQAFNTSISGTLLAAVPPAIVCDTARPHSYDRTACARVGEGWLRSSFHSDDPVSVAYPNWQDDACLPTAISNSSTSCDVRPFPEYVVNASDATHVAEAIRFASKTRVRLIVKGGAHDLLGRYVPHHVGLAYRAALVDCIVHCVADPRHLRRSPFGLGIFWE